MAKGRANGAVAKADSREEQEIEIRERASDLPQRELSSYDTNFERAQALNALQERVLELANSQMEIGFSEAECQRGSIELETMLYRAGKNYNLSPKDYVNLRKLYNAIIAEQKASEQAKLLAIFEQAEELARTGAHEAFDPDKTPEKIEAHIRSLQEQHGLSGIPWGKVIERYTNAREKARKAALLAEVGIRARSRANADFRRGPGSGPSNRTQSELGELLSKFADIQDRDFLSKVAVEKFQREYSNKRDYLYDTKLNWLERRWYDVKSFCISIWDTAVATIDAIGNAASAVYEGVKALASLAAEVIETAATFVADTVVAAYNIVTDLSTYQTMWDYACSFAEGAWTVATATYNFLTSEETWNSVREGLKSAYNFITAESTWEAINGGLSKAWEFVSSEENWDKVKNALLTAGSALLDPRNCLAAAKAILHAVCNPIDTLKRAWNATAGIRNFLKQMSDQIGLTDIVVGAWNLIKTPYVFVKESLKTAVNTFSDFASVISGEMTAEEFGNRLKNNVRSVFSETASTLKEGLRAIKGGVLLLGELTGVTDLVLCVSCALRGDWLGASMHGAFALLSAGTIIATVATVGAAAPAMLAVATGRSSIKQAGKKLLAIGAREFFEKSAQSLGKEAIQVMEKRVGAALAEKMGQELSEDAMQMLGREMLQQNLRLGAIEIAETGSKELAERVMQQGSEVLTTELAREVMKESSEKITERILREAGLAESVKDVTLTFLKTMKGKSRREIQQLLMKEGICNKETAKAAARTIRKAIRTGNADKVIMDIFEEGMSRQVRNYVEAAMEQPFKNRFKSILSGEVTEEYSQTLARAAREQAKRLGKELDEFVDELVEAGWKGVKEGIEAAARKLVREGIKAAFKEFRKPRPKLPRPRGGGVTGGSLSGRILGEDDMETSHSESSEIESNTEQDERRLAPERERTKTVSEHIAGSEFLVKYEQLRSGEWIRTESRLVKKEEK